MTLFDHLHGAYRQGTNEEDITVSTSASQKSEQFKAVKIKFRVLSTPFLKKKILELNYRAWIYVNNLPRCKASKWRYSGVHRAETCE